MIQIKGIEVFSDGGKWVRRKSNGTYFKRATVLKGETTDDFEEVDALPDPDVQQAIADALLPETENGGIVRLDVELSKGQSVDMGISLGELEEKNPLFITDKNQRLFYISSISSKAAILIGILFESYGNNCLTNKVFILSNNGDGTVAVTERDDTDKIPAVGSDGKLPAEVLPEQEPHVEFSLQLHNGDLLMICKEGEILPTDEIRFYRRGRYCTRTIDKVSEVCVGFNKKDGWRTNGQNNRDGNYETYIPMTFGKEKLEQGVDGNPKLVGMDVWKLTAIENQSGFADPFPALFRSAMVRLRYPNEKDLWDVCIRDGRDGKKYGWEDFQKLSQTGEIRKTVHAGVAVHRNNKRISDIVPFKIRFHLINDGTLSAEIPPTIDDNYVRVTLRI